MALSISSTSQVSIFNIPSTQSPKIFPFSVCLNSITLNCSKLQSIVCAAAKQQSGSSVKSNKKRKKKPSPISKDLSFEDLGVLEETESGFEEEEDSGNGKSKRSEAYIPLPLPKPPAGFVIDEQGQVLMAASRRIATIVE